MDKLNEAVRAIQSLGIKAPGLIAIDGRCASGKTLLADMLRRELDCNVVHIDDFYLPFSVRTTERMAQPAGNIDRDRLLSEILLPLKRGEAVRYRPYDCHADVYLDEEFLDPSKITVVEGSYSCHPELRELYSYRIFMTVAPAEQLRRLRLRNASSVDAFQKQWIPREEHYFETFRITESCELIIEN